MALTKKPVVALATGQMISVLLALTGFTSTLLTSSGFEFPVFQSTGFYFFLSLLLFTRPFPLKLPLYLYAGVTILDVEANFLAVKAYQYTDITSILLLNSLTIPWTVILSYLVFKRRYSFKQLGSIAFCLVGLGLIIVSDTLRGRWLANESRASPWIGDLLCVGSSFLYASQNVMQEYLLKRLTLDNVRTPFCEYLGMLGAFGFLFSNIQWLIVEREAVVESWPHLWTSSLIWTLVGFSLTMVALYSLLAWYIQGFDASVFNMNILTSGIYGLLMCLIYGNLQINRSSDWLYILAYAVIVAGVISYSMSEPKTVTSKHSSELASPLSDPVQSSVSV
jgi:solute carrier family 35 protein F1/2